jgi:SulP family sulfate permease
LLRIESLQPQPLEVLVRSGFAEELTTGQPGASHGA